MSNTDFFDDDLLRRREVASPAAGDPVVSGRPSDKTDVPARPVSDLNLTRMAKRKEEMSLKAGTASREIENLRRRQEELEREKRSLEEMCRKQDEYLAGKREMADGLAQSIALLEQKEVHAARLAELYAGTRQRFKEMLQGIQAIDETTWPEESIREELNKALVLIDDARKEYHRAMAKIEASGGIAESAAPLESTVQTGFGPRIPELPGFRYWLRVGVAVTLPLILAAVVLTAIHIVLR